MVKYADHLFVVADGDFEKTIAGWTGGRQVHSISRDNFLVPEDHHGACFREVHLALEEMAINILNWLALILKRSHTPLELIDSNNGYDVILRQEGTYRSCLLQ